MTTNMSPPPPKNPTTTTTTTDSSESMPPPPPKTPNTTTTTNSSESMPPPPPKAPSTTTTTLSESMPPPPPKNPNPPKLEEKEVKLIPPESTVDANSNESSTSSSTVAASPSKETNDNNLENKREQRSSTSSSNNNIAVPYTVPSWSGIPSHSYSLEVLKDGSIIDQFNTNEKGAYMFGRVDLCDFILEHPTISRFHAVLQFKSDGSAYLYDLGSTHGTFVNKNQVKKRVYIELHVGDVIKFGHSTRLYILQGPTDLMPPEADLERIRKAKMGMNNRDMEESLKRAKLEASRASGVSWGMQEDAIEENEDEVEEITWQTYKGQLTEKQEKTREKVIKRLEKITHMKKEIDAIRAKDISQGGLTQGQQTQIARNEQRISQILEELENLEETLNESIRESLGARSGRIIIHGKRKIPGEEEEEEYLSDEDEFYDRTQKVSKPKIGENQAIETADSLLDKRDEIILKIEDKKKLLLIKKDDVIEKNDVMVSGDDELDAYMSSLSSQLVLNEKELINKEISTLESELDKILYLLKVADPIGEASRKRDFKEINENISIIPIQKPEITKDISSENKKVAIETEKKEEKAPEYTIVKPQWLGAVPEKKKEEIIVGPAEENEDENDGFVDYKDRSKISEKIQSIENAGPGLIIRKRKKVEKDEVSEVKEEEVNNEAEMKAEDAVALLLRHSRGYKVSEDDEIKTDKRKKKKKKQDSESTWVPPKGQSGDGRTSLNDRYGY